MSVSLDRIIASVKTRALLDSDLDDCDVFTSVAVGDWKDAINVELKSIRKEIEQVAEGLEQRHDSDDDLATAARLRFAVREL